MVQEGGGTPSHVRTFLVPQSDFVVEDVWHAVGLRGTGSNDLHIAEVFVPEHRTLSAAQVALPECPGHAVNPEPLYRMPLATIFTTSISVAIVGMAEAGLAAYLDATRKRIRVVGNQRVAEDPFAQVRIARAASAVDGAWLQLTRNVADVYTCAESGEDTPLGLRTRLRRDQPLATERAVGAVDLVMENAGGSAMRSGGALERIWRDVHTGRGHVVNDVESALAMFGRDALGLEVTGAML
ncbi:hypothetical protein [Amycolatopsis ultiminotia]|uniref:hypothetical protein n=1 Tax=Amycolatopsis ultiminotia TaxID=543629 RepID=UPI0031E8D200